MFRRTRVLSTELMEQRKVVCGSRTEAAVAISKVDKEMEKGKERRTRKAEPCVSSSSSMAIATKEQTVIIAIIHLLLATNKGAKETEPAAKRRRRIKVQDRAVRIIIRMATTIIRTRRINKERQEVAKERAKAKVRTRINRIRTSIRYSTTGRRCFAVSS